MYMYVLTSNASHLLYDNAVCVSDDLHRCSRDIGQYLSELGIGDVRNTLSNYQNDYLAPRNS